MDQYAAEAQDTFFVAREEELPGFFCLYETEGIPNGHVGPGRDMSGNGLKIYRRIP